MIDLDSDTWLTVAAFIDDEQNKALAALSSPALDLPTTQFVRGQLAALRAVRELPQAAQQPISFSTLTEGVY